MGLRRSTLIITVIVLLVAVVLAWQYFSDASCSSSCYSIDGKYFGLNVPKWEDAEDTSIRPFKIPFDRSQVNDMLSRVKGTRFYEPQIVVDNLSANKSTYGFNRQTLEKVRDYLVEKYDWQKTVQELNGFNHFKTNIEGLDIHFVRVTRQSQPNEKKEALIFLHGWPGSFLEYLDAAQILSNSSKTIYDIIIPSLPGYGYSDPAVRAGLNPAQMARIMHRLMERVGYSTYVVCGGDWGSIIGTHIAQLYPKNVRGLLITMIVPNLRLHHIVQMALGHLISPSLLFSQDEQAFLVDGFNALDYAMYLWREGGYFHLQATKPDTIGYALNDSPLGLVAYILEKWSRWSNTQAQVDRSESSGLDRFTFDQLLSNVMLYWTTGTITSSMRTYFEFSTQFTSGINGKLLQGSLSPSVPVAVVNFRYELLYTPRTIALSKYPNIKMWTYHDDGGHFGSMEKPTDYVRDIKKFLLQL